MNNWNNEYMAEYHRQDLIRETDQIRRIKMGINRLTHRPGLFAQTMFNFGNWMILTGKRLRKRYEIPSAVCNHTPSGNFVR